MLLITVSLANLDIIYLKDITFLEFERFYLYNINLTGRFDRTKKLPGNVVFLKPLSLNNKKILIIK